MDARRWNKLAILAKLEATYGTNATPLAANAILATNVTFTPIEAEEVSHDLLLPYMGVAARQLLDRSSLASGRKSFPPPSG